MQDDHKDGGDDDCGSEDLKPKHAFAEYEVADEQGGERFHATEKRGGRTVYAFECKEEEDVGKHCGNEAQKEQRAQFIYAGYAFQAALQAHVHGEEKSGEEQYVEAQYQTAQRVDATLVHSDYVGGIGEYGDDNAQQSPAVEAARG